MTYSKKLLVNLVYMKLKLMTLKLRYTWNPSEMLLYNLTKYCRAFSRDPWLITSDSTVRWSLWKELFSSLALQVLFLTSPIKAEVTDQVAKPEAKVRLPSAGDTRDTGGVLCQVDPNSEPVQRLFNVVEAVDVTGSISPLPTASVVVWVGVVGAISVFFEVRAESWLVEASPELEYQ